jgi:hypothetical protein
MIGRMVWWESAAAPKTDEWEIAEPKRDKQPTKSSKAVVVRNLIS